jgi:hypothetical protein
MFHLVFVLAANVLSLSVHCAHVSFVPVTQLIHSLNEIVTLLGQVRELSIHKVLLLMGFRLLASECVKFIVESI